jgi:hypothetical protein
LRSGLEGLAILLIVALLLPLYAHISLALEPSTSTGTNLSTPRTQPRTETPQSSAYKFVTLALPVKLLRNLVGVSIKSIVASPCYDDTIVIVPYVLPKRFMRSFMPSLNATVLRPDFGDGVLTEDDVLILEVPIPIGRAVSARCGWAVHAVKSGLRERYMVALGQGMQVATEKGLEVLQNPITIVIYFDKNQSRRSLIYDTPFDVEALKTLSIALGVQPPEQPRLVHDFNAKEIIEAENMWNNWLKNIRSRVAAEANSIARRLTATYERRAGFVYDPLSDRVVAEIESKELEKAVYQQLKDVYPQAYLIDGGGGPSRFYDFTLVLAKEKDGKPELIGRVDGVITKKLYLGYNIYSATVYVRAKSSSTSTAYLGIDVSIVDVDTKSVVWSNSYRYSLGPQPQDIYIYPSIPFDTTRKFNITITFRWSGGAQPYIEWSTLKFIKVWDKMPTEQTVKAYQILSAGIATIRDKSGALPPGCQRAKASDMLDPVIYKENWYIPGVVVTRSHACSYEQVIAGTCVYSISIDSTLMNGLYYDSLYRTSPILYIDICVTSSISQEGDITLMINGIRYATQKLVADPSKLCNYVGFTILLDWNLAKGHGHEIMLVTTLPSTFTMRIDALIEYLYAPEVWKESSTGSWSWALPWFKLYLPQYVVGVLDYSSSLVLEITATNYRPWIKVGHLVVKGYGTSISSASIMIKPVGAFSPDEVEGTVAKIAGTSYEPYFGWISVLAGIIALVPSEVVSTPASVISIVTGALTLRGEIKTIRLTPDGTYMLSWTAGPLDQYTIIRLRLRFEWGGLATLPTSYYVWIEANGYWVLRPIYVSIPRIYSPSGPYKPYYGFYNRKDIIYD